MLHRDWASRLAVSNRRMVMGVAAAALVVAVAAAALLGSGSGAGETGVAGGDAAASADDFPITVYQGADALGGTEIDFNSLLGRGKPVVLNFWAAQCPPCRVEMPWFEATYQRYKDRVLLVGVDIGPFVGLGSNQQARELLAELGVTYPAGAALDDRAVREYRVIGMPTTVFFDADGKQVNSHSGLLIQEQIDEAFRELADGGTP